MRLPQSWMDIGPRNLLNLSCFFSHLDFEVCEVQSKPTCKTNVSSADLLFEFEAGHSQTPFGSPHFVDLQLLRKFSRPFRELTLAPRVTVRDPCRRLLPKRACLCMRRGSDSLVLLDRLFWSLDIASSLSFLLEFQSIPTVSSFPVLHWIQTFCSFPVLHEEQSLETHRKCQLCHCLFVASLVPLFYNTDNISNSTFQR